MGKRIGRYNIKFGDNVIKYNAYINDYGNVFIYFDGKYVVILKHSSYRGGILWIVKEEL